MISILTDLPCLALLARQHLPAPIREGNERCPNDKKRKTVRDLLWYDGRRWMILNCLPIRARIRYFPQVPAAIADSCRFLTRVKAIELGPLAYKTF